MKFRGDNILPNLFLWLAEFSLLKLQDWDPPHHYPLSSTHRQTFLPSARDCSQHLEVTFSSFPRPLTTQPQGISLTLNSSHTSNISDFLFYHQSEENLCFKRADVIRSDPPRYLKTNQFETLITSAKSFHSST